MRARRALRVLSWLVPEPRRESWRREWEAELVHLDRLLEEAGHGRLRRGMRTALHTVDAMEDAMGMWARSRGGGRGPRELRAALRSLARSPGFTAVAVLTLALGIGANTAVFSVVRSVALRPLPYADPGALVYVGLSFRNPATGADRGITASEPEYLELLDAESGLADVAAFWSREVNLGGGTRPLRVPAAYVSANLLGVLGVDPALGRAFAAGEDRPGGGGTVLLSHGLWMRAFGGDRSIVGRAVELEGRPVRVVGVLPEGFVFPSDPVDVLATNRIDPADPAGRSSHYLTMVGRLAPGTPREAAQARLDELARRWAEAAPGRHGVSPTHPLTLVPLRDAMIGDARATLWIVLGAVALVLLVACANVAALMVVRAEHRRHERGIRVALGGGRVDVAAPVLLESLLLALAGGLVGLGLAWATPGFAERLGPDVIRRVGGVEIDGGVLLFTAGAALLTTFVFGLGPALGAWRGDPVRALRSGSRDGEPPRRTRARQSLVVAQIALSVVLAVASGLLLRSFVRLQAVDPGFDPEGRVSVQFSLSSGAYPEAEDVVAFHEALAARLRDAPGVRGYGAVRALPFAERPGLESLVPTDRPFDPDQDGWTAWYQVVWPGWTEAMGIPLLRGRRLAPGDDAEAPGAALVSATMAEGFWPGEEALGRTFKLGGSGTPNPELTVVGIVGDVRQEGYDAGVGPQLYVPLGQATRIYGGLGTREQSVVVWSDLPADDALELVRGAVRTLDPGLAVARAATMEGLMARSLAGPRFVTVLVGAFSALALVLGAVGVAGLVAYTVARRTRELGLRMALGADGSRLVRRVLRGALGLAALGVAIGTVVAFWASDLLADQLFAVGARDPAVFLAAPALLLVTAAAAALGPARRATRVDPARAMRSE